MDLGVHFGDVQIPIGMLAFEREWTLLILSRFQVPKGLEIIGDDLPALRVADSQSPAKTILSGFLLIPDTLFFMHFLLSDCLAAIIGARVLEKIVLPEASFF